MAAREVPVSVALAGLSASVALTFGAIFSSNAYVAPLVAAAVLPHVLGWLTRRWTPSAVASTLVSLGGLVVAAVAWSGSPSAINDDVRRGWDLLLHGNRPIPASHGAVLLLALVVFAVGAVTDDLAFRRDASVAVLAPPIVAVIWVRVLASGGGWLLSTVLFGASAVAFLALQQQALLARRRTRVGRSARGLTLRLLAAVVVAGVVATVGAAALVSALPLPRRPIAPLEDFLNRGNTGNVDYSAHTPPEIDVGNMLRRGSRQELFTVAASAPAYWRTTSLDQYSADGGGSWTLTAHGSGAVGQGLNGRPPVGALHQQYAIGPLDERWMPAAFEAVRVSRPGTFVVRASGTLVTDTRSVQDLTYAVDSQLPTALPTEAQQLATAAPVPASLKSYLSLPSGLPAPIRAFVRNVTAASTLPYDQARLLRDYFRTNFMYDPNTRLGDDQNAMVQFLSTRRGFCVQFAATYAVMARLLGIPSRVAVGFTSGTASGGVYHVTNLDAHAWPEIWLAGLGWTDLFDPTPRTNDPGASARAVEPPVTTSRPTQTPTTVPAPSTPSPNSPGGSASPTPTPTPGPSRVSVSRPSPSSGLSALAWVLVILGLVAVGVLAALVAVMARKARRRAQRRAAADPAEQVAGAWAEALDGLRAARVGWPSSLTPHEVAEQVPARVGDRLAPPLGALANRYTAARYGDVPPSPEVVQAAWRDADAVLDALRDSLDLPTRLRSRLRVGAAAAQPEPAGWSVRRRSSTKD